MNIMKAAAFVLCANILPAAAWDVYPDGTIDTIIHSKKGQSMVVYVENDSVFVSTIVMCGAHSTKQFIARVNGKKIRMIDACRQEITNVISPFNPTGNEFILGELIQGKDVSIGENIVIPAKGFADAYEMATSEEIL